MGLFGFALVYLDLIWCDEIWVGLLVFDLVCLDLIGFIWTCTGLAGCGLFFKDFDGPTWV